MLQFISVGKDFLNEIPSGIGNKTNNQYMGFNETSFGAVKGNWISNPE